MLPSRLGDRLAAARRRAFVGRRAELDLITRVLDGREPATVVYVHGPGGVGKSSLLRQVGWLAEDAGRPVRRLDGHEFDPGPVEPRGVLLVDEVDAIPGRRAAVLEALLADLPADAVAILAGRAAPPAAWRSDPGWQAILTPVRLGDLDDADARALLRQRGVPESAHAEALAFTHGHPLALALLADVARPAGAVPDGETVEMLGVLLDALVGSVPSPAHLAALEAAAQVAAVTEPLLAALLDVPDARELFDWLRDLAVVDVSPRGLHLHDVARAALARELRWRHPEAHARLHARARAFYDTALRGADPVGARRVVFDVAFLHRDSPVIGPFLRHLTPGGADDGLSTARATPTEVEAVLVAIARHEGAAAAAVTARWARVQPDAVTAVRDAGGGLAGWIVAPALDRATAADRTGDPVAACAWAHAQAVPPGRGETVLLVRHWGDVQVHQAVSPVQAHITLHLVRRYLTTPGLAQVYVQHADPGFWASAMAYTGFEPAPGGLFVHDWRTVPPTAWMARLAGREHGAPDGPVPPALDEAGFAAAVRDALRDVGRPDRLVDSPLAGTRTVARRLPSGAAPADRGRAVRDALLAAAAVVEASPRDRRAFRALHHTYLQPAATQAAAAELLDLPTTTYRRHLAAGIARVTELLWQEEVG